ncbi:hypothetical protein NP284_16110 [Rhodopseudomonas pseudopalustris]|uniref:hypothetical protein n=1 Tax=Rhodopseudomonas pseudopalustris TaxID=1513892 RepID=UPI003F956FFD
MRQWKRFVNLNNQPFVNHGGGERQLNTAGYQQLAHSAFRPAHRSICAASTIIAATLATGTVAIGMPALTGALRCAA